MSKILKCELKRGLFNKWTLISLVCASVFCVLHFMDLYESRMSGIELSKELGYTCVDSVNVSTPYIRWILFDYNQYVYILLFVMPILATLPYGTSFYADMKSGYVKQMASRLPMKIYTRAKYIATFLTGGTVMTLPMFIEFFVLATIDPLHKPYRYDMYITGEETFCIDVFYEHPMIYTLLRLMLVFVVAGLLAATALLVSKYVSNFFSVFITPFVLSFMLIFFSRVANVSELDFSATLHARSSGEYNYSILFIEIIVMFVCTYFGFVTSKKEVY